MLATASSLNKVLQSSIRRIAAQDCPSTRQCCLTRQNDSLPCTVFSGDALMHPKAQAEMESNMVLEAASTSVPSLPTTPGFPGSQINVGTGPHTDSRLYPLLWALGVPSTNCIPTAGQHHFPFLGKAVAESWRRKRKTKWNLLKPYCSNSSAPHLSKLPQRQRWL